MAEGDPHLRIGRGGGRKKEFQPAVTLQLEDTFCRRHTVDVSWNDEIKHDCNNYYALVLTVSLL